MPLMPTATATAHWRMRRTQLRTRLLPLAILIFNFLLAHSANYIFRTHLCHRLNAKWNVCSENCCGTSPAVAPLGRRIGMGERERRDCFIATEKTFAVYSLQSTHYSHLKKILKVKCVLDVIEVRMEFGWHVSAVIHNHNLCNSSFLTFLPSFVSSLVLSFVLHYEHVRACVLGLSTWRSIRIFSLRIASLCGLCLIYRNWMEFRVSAIAWRRNVL